MKKILLLFTLFAGLANAQNFDESHSQPPKCFGECNGSITFTTSSVSGPFTASLVNADACPNSTVQNSTVNSITINSICACPGAYTCSIYNASMAVVGTMVFQYINYAVAPLVVNTTTIGPASCSMCCDGEAYFSVSGGNQQSPPTFSIDGAFIADAAPASSLCVGTHTVCVEDPSGCIACKEFQVNYEGGSTGLAESAGDKNLIVFPNPAIETLFIQSTKNKQVAKVILYDHTGRAIHYANLSNHVHGQQSIDISMLDSGFYALLAYDQSGRLLQHQKVLIGSQR
jgi:hypothetical protein